MLYEVITGDKDLQVPSKENLNGIKVILEKAGNKNITIKELPNRITSYNVCYTKLLRFGALGGRITGKQQEYFKAVRTVFALIFVNWH